jgi:hypothetical protein
MSPLAKLALFAAGLVAVFSGGLAVGAVVGPLEQDPAPRHVPAHVHEGFGR